MRRFSFLNDLGFVKSRSFLSIIVALICFKSHMLGFSYRTEDQTLIKNVQNLNSKNTFHTLSLSVSEVLENFISIGDDQKTFFNINGQFNLGEQISPDGNIIAAITSRAVFDKRSIGNQNIPSYQLDYYLYVYDKNTKEIFTEKIAWCKFSDTRGEVPDSYLLAFGFTSSSQIYVVGNDRIMFLKFDKNKIVDSFYVKTKQKLLGYHSFTIELITEVEGSSELYKPADLNTMARYFPKDDLILLIPCGNVLVSNHYEDLIFVNYEQGQNTYLNIEDGILAYEFSPDQKYMAIYSRKYAGNYGLLNIIDFDTKQISWSFNIEKAKFVSGASILWLSNRTVATFSLYNPYLAFGGKAVLMSIFDLELNSEVLSSNSILNLRANFTRLSDLLNILILKSECFKPQKYELETEREFQQRLSSILSRCNELQKEAFKYFQNRTIPVRFPASLGQYSADNEEFIMNFLKKSFKLKVKRDIAPILIKKRDKDNVFYVNGEIKLDNRGNFILLDSYFISPDSDIKIPIFD